MVPGLDGDRSACPRASVSTVWAVAESEHPPMRGGAAARLNYRDVAVQRRIGAVDGPLDDALDGPLCVLLAAACGLGRWSAARWPSRRFRRGLGDHGACACALGAPASAFASWRLLAPLVAWVWDSLALVVVRVVGLALLLKRAFAQRGAPVDDDAGHRAREDGCRISILGRSPIRLPMVYPRFCGWACTVLIPWSLLVQYRSRTTFYPTDAPRWCPASCRCTPAPRLSAPV